RRSSDLESRALWGNSRCHRALLEEARTSHYSERFTWNAPHESIRLQQLRCAIRVKILRPSEAGRGEKARGPARASTDKIRADHQPQDRQGARARSAADSSRRPMR